MKINDKKTITLSVDELKKILMDHLVEFCNVEDVDDENKDVTIEHVIKRTQLPGHEIYDCDWREEFDGLKITIDYKHD